MDLKEVLVREGGEVLVKEHELLWDDFAQYRQKELFALKDEAQVCTSFSSIPLWSLYSIVLHYISLEELPSELSASSAGLFYLKRFVAETSHATVTVQVCYGYRRRRRRSRGKVRLNQTLQIEEKWPTDCVFSCLAR